MKLLGILLSTACLLMALVLLWLGVVIAEESSWTRNSESKTPEGFQYWHDVRIFSQYALAALVTFALPCWATVVLFRRATVGMGWLVVAFSGTFSSVLLWGYVLMAFLQRDDNHWTFLLPVISLSGCAFAAQTFYRHRKLSSP